jgi:hypothetical protein
LKSDILGLRKELKAAKAAPASLEKERDGLRKDLEKLKIKLGDVEAKLKSTLIEKSKVEVGDVHYLVYLYDASVHHTAYLQLYFMKYSVNDSIDYVSFVHLFCQSPNPDLYSWMCRLRN